MLNFAYVDIIYLTVSLHNHQMIVVYLSIYKIFNYIYKNIGNLLITWFYYIEKYINKNFLKILIVSRFSNLVRINKLRIVSKFRISLFIYIKNISVYIFLLLFFQLSHYPICFMIYLSHIYEIDLRILFLLLALMKRSNQGKVKESMEWNKNIFIRKNFKVIIINYILI